MERNVKAAHDIFRDMTEIPHYPAANNFAAAMIKHSAH